jgi:hypothetical protein
MKRSEQRSECRNYFHPRRKSNFRVWSHQLLFSLLRAQSEHRHCMLLKFRRHSDCLQLSMKGRVRYDHCWWHECSHQSR